MDSTWTFTYYTDIDKVFDKVKKVILSCKNTGQMYSANKMIKLFSLKYGQYYEYAKLVDIYYHKSEEFTWF